MKVIILCEFSGVVRDAFRERGHDAISCDLLPSERPGPHLQMDCREITNWNEYDLMIGHPPCTYLNRAGWHWVNKPDCATLPLKGEPRRKAAKEAAEFFMMLLNINIPHICIENPKPIRHVNLPPSSQKIQPWEFGHGEVKETHLWLKGLPLLYPTNIVSGRKPRVHHESPSPVGWMNRSRTLEGIAKAMAEQWGDVLSS